MPPLTTKTIGPLHLEDLEPHRFEDLVRQLIYDFRAWRMLEATGRSGGDDGFDARGYEIVASAAGEETVEEDGEESAEVGADDRLWLIQCKRGPGKLVDYLDAVPAAELTNLHGIVFAAACDFSKKARDAENSACPKRNYGARRRSRTRYSSRRTITSSSPISAFLFRRVGAA
jgi:hypothetical protein